MVRRQVDVVVAPGFSVAALAAKALTTTIPIVFTTFGDPNRSLRGRGHAGAFLSIGSPPIFVERIRLAEIALPDAMRAYSPSKYPGRKWRHERS